MASGLSGWSTTSSDVRTLSTPYTFDVGLMRQGTPKYADSSGKPGNASLRLTYRLTSIIDSSPLN